jgi:hypothetical protein
MISSTNGEVNIYHSNNNKILFNKNNNLTIDTFKTISNSKWQTGF